MMIDRLDPTHPLVKRADATINSVLDTPGHEDLVMLYCGPMWEKAMELGESDTDEMIKLAYFCALQAIVRTLPLASPEAWKLSVAFASDKLRDMLLAAAAESELDAQVRPLLAWLDS